MKRKYVLLCLFIILLISGYLFRRTHLLSHLGNFNAIEITTNNIVDKQLIRLTLFTEGNLPAIVYDKGQTYTIPEEYGPNELVVRYNDSISCSIVQWKYNCNHDHLYDLSFIEKDNSLFCIFEIKGEEELADTVRLR